MYKKKHLTELQANVNHKKFPLVFKIVRLIYSWFNLPWQMTKIFPLKFGLWPNKWNGPYLCEGNGGSFCSLGAHAIPSSPSSWPFHPLFLASSPSSFGHLAFIKLMSRNGNGMEKGNGRGWVVGLGLG
jgi:hypothetical protein